MNKLLWSAVGLLILINGVVLAHSYYNRHEVQARITLSERELNAPNNYGFEKENSGVSLSVHWSAKPDTASDGNYYGRDLKLSDAHYATFRFSGSCDHQGSDTNEQGFVLVEFNGSTHQQITGRLKTQLNHLKQSSASTEKIKNVNDELQLFEKERSRLYIIDAAATRNTLEASLPKHEKVPGNQFLILPAVISDAYSHCEGKQKNPHTIYIDELLVGHIYVPREYHALFSDKKQDQHFQATIAFGKLDEPWLESLELCEKECKAQ